MVLAGCHSGLGAVKEAEERAIRVQPLSKSGCHLYTKWRPSGRPPTDTWNPKEGWPPARYVCFASLCFALLRFALLFLARFCFSTPPFLCCSCLRLLFSLSPGNAEFSLVLLCFALLCFAFSFLSRLLFYLCSHALFFVSSLRIPVSALLYLLCSSVPFLASLCFALPPSAFFPWLSLSWHRFVFPCAPFLSFAVFMNA